MKQLSLPRSQAAALVAAALVTMPALAQVAAPPVKKAAEPTVQQVEIKGSAEAYNPRRDDTASKIVVGHEEIVKYGDTNVLDVLKRLPGVTVSGSGRGGGEVRMRGLGSGYTQVLVNGERAPAGFSLDAVAPDTVERIEVLRAASAEFSTQSIAGTINIILKKTVKSGGLREVKYGAQVGKTSKSPSANLQLSDKLGQLSYSVSAAYYTSRFERDAPTAEEAYDPLGRPVLLRASTALEDGRFTAMSLAPRLNWTFANGDTLTSQSFFNSARFRRQSDQTTTTTLGPQPAYPFIDWTLANDNSFYRTDLNWVTKLGQGAKLDTKLGVGVNTIENDSKRLGYGARAGTLTLDNRVTSRAVDHPYTFTGKYSTPVLEGHALALGWDGGITRRDETRIQRERAIAGVAVPFAALNSDEHFNADVKRLAAFIQDEWNVTPRWSVYFGLRWEGIRTHVEGSGFDAVTVDSRVWSPLFQTLYKLPDSKGDQIRFALTRTYKATQTGYLVPRRYTTANNSSTDPDFSGNPQLKPELALGFDTSYEHYWAEGALFSVSASMRRIEDYTRNIVLQGLDGRWLAMPSNSGAASTRGIEMELKFPLKAVMAAAPALELRASVSRNWSSVDSVPGPNNRLDQQTPFSATLGADYKRGALTTGASYALKNGGLVRQSLAQSSYVSVRRELDLYALWKFDAKNQLRIALSNLLEQDYINDSSYTDRQGTVNRRATYPGEAALRWTMETKF